MSLARQLVASLRPLSIQAFATNFLDILVVAYVFYRLILLIRGTRAWQIMWGLGIFFGAVTLSAALHLDTLYWMLQKFVYMGPVAIVILFYPELRHALEEMGRIRWWGTRFNMMGGEEAAEMTTQIVKAAVELSQKKIGALVVIECETHLDTIIVTGKRLDADLSSELLGAIFYPGGPLHDQAVIVAGKRIVAASCVLPLSDDPSVGLGVHTRHRAALGMSEQSDAIVVVVSEETGAISVCRKGRMIRGLTKETLRDWLLSSLQPPKPVQNGQPFWRRRSPARDQAQPD
jgi:diadenylate cyclase